MVTFQLSLELAGIVKPLIQSALALGSLALGGSSGRAGSDIITEKKLEVLLGRHHIDPAIDFHFRQAVNKSDQTLLSQCLELTLQSGAGPTVQDALKNPPLFSTIVQLSALAFAHNHDALANAMVIAAERILRDGGAALENAPDYGSLVSVIMACRQQTAAFRWAFVYENVESKILSAVESKSKNSKSKKTRVTSLQIHERSLQFPVLQSFLMWLKTVQSLPEHRLLHVRCNTGISTAVVWCHFILGLNVLVRIDGVDVVFGNGATTVVIVWIDSLLDAGVSLLDASCQDEPLFTLSLTTEDVIMSSDIRADAYGFGLRLLNLMLPDDEKDRRESIEWIILLACFNIDEENLAPLVIHLPHLRREILCAGTFFFALSHSEAESIRSRWENRDLPKEIPKHLGKKLWFPLLALLISFARVPLLERCARMPLSLDVFLHLQEEDFEMWTREASNNHASGHDLWQLHCGNQADGPQTMNVYWHRSFDVYRPSTLILNSLASYRLLSQLLLGRSYSKDYIWPSCLISAWGWIVMLDSVDVADPDHFSTEKIRVLYGTPSRRGVRKNRVINGPGVMCAGLHEQKRHKLNHRPEVTLFPGDSEIEKGPLLVGHHGQASISAMQTFRIQRGSSRQPGGKLQIGLYDMYELCTRFLTLPPCQCSGTTYDVASMTGKHAVIDMISNGMNYEVHVAWQCRWPKDGGTTTDVDAKVMVAQTSWGPPDSFVPGKSEAMSQIACLEGPPGDIWFFSRAKSSPARWAQMLGLCYQDSSHEHDGPDDKYIHYRKDPDCCFDCVLRMICKNRDCSSHQATTLVLV